MNRPPQIVLLLLFFTFSLSAQIVNIPDPVFKWALVNSNCSDTDGDGFGDVDVDTNNDGEIQVSEAEAVTGLIIMSTPISSMQGIESFINLELLYCSFNQIELLDVTNLSNLKVLNCNHNQINNLDVSQNPNLEILDCRSNNFSSIDISQNQNLTYLNVSELGLSTINVTNNPLIEYLSVSGNQLTDLDINNQTELKILNFQNNNIINIDLTHNPLLENLNSALNKLTSLDIYQNQNIELLYSFGNQLQTLDLSNNSSLTHVYLMDNLLSSINIQNNNNNLIYIFDATNNPNLKCIQVDDVEYSNNQNCTNPAPNWCKDESAVYSEDCELGIEENTFNFIKVYPVPSKERLTIESQEPILKVIFYGMLGHKLQEIISNFSDIPIASLPSGLLLLEIETDKGVVIQKIVKE